MKLPDRIDRFLTRVLMSRMEDIPFIIFTSFLTSFAIARTYVYLTHQDILSSPIFIESIKIRGIHAHHLNIGIVLLAICGFVALYDMRQRVHRITAIVYGIGLGLTFDEFALWLFLEDKYWSRISYDAIIIISLIFLNIIYFPSFWKRRGRNIKQILQSFKKILFKKKTS